MNIHHKKVIVCGTRFGFVYLSAFLNRHHPFKLCGILAKGSSRSKKYAEYFGVPLYTDINSLPNDIDIACVVINSTMTGGQGTDIALQLLQKGINVIQEHPVHHGDLVKCYQYARKYGVHYHLNTHHIHAEPVRKFCNIIKKLKNNQNIIYINAIGAIQVASSLLDIIGTAIGGIRPFTILNPLDTSNICTLSGLKSLPYINLQGVLSGIPFSLSIQNQYDPDDPDNNAYILHRVNIILENGTLSLLGSSGPVIWTDRLHLKWNSTLSSDIDFQNCLDRIDASAHPSAISLYGATAPSVKETFQTILPDGIVHALYEMKDAIEGKTNESLRAQYYLDLTQFWNELLSKVGPPDLVKFPYSSTEVFSFYDFNKSEINSYKD